MKVPTCPREAEVVDAIVSHGWPTSVDRGLVAHVETCRVCADVAAVAQAMRDEHVLACQEARVPSAGVVWWRAELRARQEAARAATRPMTLVHVVAGACGLGAVLTIASLMVPWLRGTLSAIFGGPLRLDDVHVDVATVTTLVAQGGLPLVLAIGAWLVLVPITLYVALSRD